MTEVKEKTV